MVTDAFHKRYRDMFDQIEIEWCGAKHTRHVSTYKIHTFGYHEHGQYYVSSRMEGDKWYWYDGACNGGKISIYDEREVRSNNSVPGCIVLELVDV